MDANRRFWWRRQLHFGAWLCAYVLSGCMQTLLVDSLRLHRALGQRILLLPTLANVVGMALCGSCASAAERRLVVGLLRSSPALRSRVAIAAAVDLLSGMLLTIGLLLTGGSVFIVLYNSVPVWTAALSWLVLGRRLGWRKLAGVVAVCAGLILSALGTHEQHAGSSSARFALAGSAACLGGSLLHSAMFLLSEAALSREKSFPPLLWPCALGSVESCAMGAWVATAVALCGFDSVGVATEGDPHAAGATAPAGAGACLAGVCCLVLVNACHAAAFFALLARIGAVGAALLKGLQTVGVFVASAALFCEAEAAQCITFTRVGSIVVVLLGTLLYADPHESARDARELRSKGTLVGPRSAAPAHALA